MHDPAITLEKQESIRLDEATNKLHPAWKDFIHFCREMRHGEIERLSIQDGLPVLAEVTKKKIKFK